MILILMKNIQFQPFESSALNANGNDILLPAESVK